jgi:hypothetical protein
VRDIGPTIEHQENIIFWRARSPEALSYLEMIPRERGPPFLPVATNANSNNNRFLQLIHLYYGIPPSLFKNET